MVEMADDEAPITEFGEFMQQRDRITSARNADEIRPVRRKLVENLQLEVMELGSVLAASFSM